MKTKIVLSALLFVLTLTNAFSQDLKLPKRSKVAAVDTMANKATSMYTESKSINDELDAIKITITDVETTEAELKKLGLLGKRIKRQGENLVSLAGLKAPATKAIGSAKMMKKVKATLAMKRTIAIEVHLVKEIKAQGEKLAEKMKALKG